MTLFQNGIPVTQVQNLNASDALLCFADISQKEELLAQLADPLLENKARRFGETASRQGYFQRLSDYCYFFLFLPESGENEAPFGELEIYLLRNRLFIFSQPSPGGEAFFTRLREDTRQLSTSEDTLFSLFHLLLTPELALLADIEEKIETLEESLGGELKTQFDKLWHIRKQLMQRKRYYTSASLLVDSLAEYQQELFPKSKRNFQFLSNYLDRLDETLAHLSDYISHVQDVCQAQADLALNRSMNFLTIVTAIFLPLTLLVGWYGMNFNMPEYEYSFSYPALIVVSVLIILLIILWFRRKKLL